MAFEHRFSRADDVLGAGVRRRGLVNFLIVLVCLATSFATATVGLSSGDRDSIQSHSVANERFVEIVRAVERGLEAARSSLVDNRAEILRHLRATRESVLADLLAIFSLTLWLLMNVKSASGEGSQVYRIRNFYVLLRKENPIPKYTRFNVDTKVEERAAWLIFVSVLSTFYQLIQAPLTLGGSPAIDILGCSVDVAFWADLVIQAALLLLTFEAFASTQSELVDRARRKVSARLKVEEPELSWFERRRKVAGVIADRKQWLWQKLNEIGLSRRQLILIPAIQFATNFGLVGAERLLKLL